MLLLPIMRTRTRPSSLLLVCLIVALNVAFPTAFQVGAIGPRRQKLSHDRTSRRLTPIPHNKDSRQGHKQKFHSELRTFTSGSGEAIDYSSERARRTLVKLSSAALVLVLASTTLAPSLLSLFQSYNQCLTTNPLPTKVITGGVLATVGDALAQSGEKDKPYDKRRAASFAAFDSCYRVFQHMAFPFIISVCQGRVLGSILSKIPGLAKNVGGMTQGLAVAERVFTYQMMVVPLLYYPVFFTFSGLMQGLTIKGTFERAKANYFKCWRKNLQFWVPVQAVMFAVVPVKWQVAFTCVMGIIWSLILSVVAGKAKSD